MGFSLLNEIDCDKTNYFNGLQLNFTFFFFNFILVVVGIILLYFR